MDEPSFQQLCRNTSIYLECEVPDALGKFGRIEISGTMHTLFFDESIDADELLCMSELGRIGSKDRLEKLETLMGMNLFTIGSSDGHYALDPNRDSIIFIRRFIDLANLSPEILGLHLLNMAQHASSLSAQLPLEPVTSSTRQSEVTSTIFA